MTTLDLRGADIAIIGTVGTDVEVSFTFTDSAGDAVDVSGYTAVADVLRNGTSVETFTDAVSGAGSNVLTLTLTDTQTTTIGNERKLTWRLSMTSGSDTEHWIAGDFALYTAGHPKAGSGSSSATVTTSGAVTATVQSGGLTTAVLDGLYAPLQDTGWRKVVSWTTGTQDGASQMFTINTSEITLSGTGSLQLKRIGATCHLRLAGDATASTTGYLIAGTTANTLVTSLPAGFQGDQYQTIPIHWAGDRSKATDADFTSATTIRATAASTGATLRGLTMSWLTDDAWPSSLPGVAA